MTCRNLYANVQRCLLSLRARLSADVRGRKRHGTERRSAVGSEGLMVGGTMQQQPACSCVKVAALQR